MSGAQTIDREAMRTGLQAWLRQKFADLGDLTLSPLRFPSGTGNSAETMFATMAYEADGEHRERALVIRRQLAGTDLFLDADIRLPHRMMEALALHPHIPAPRALGVEPDPAPIGSPFLVMEAIEGRVVDQVPNYNVEGWLADLPIEQRREIWLRAIATLARLHRIDWRQGFSFLDDRQRGEPGIDQFLAWTRDWYIWAKAGRRLEVADAALDYLMANKPRDTDVSVLWGDPTPANMMFGPDLSVAALIDFEMASLGPGEADLAWWLEAEENFSTLSGVARLEGLPSRAEIIAHYEAERGRPVADLDYYSMLAWFRMNIVGIRFSDRLVGEGRMPAGTDVLTNNPATMLMARKLGMPDASPGEGFMAMVNGMAGAGA